MLCRTRFQECLRLLATVPSVELDAVARLCHLGRRVIRGMYGWTLRQLHAVLSLVKHGHLKGPHLTARKPVIAFGIVAGHEIDPFELVAAPFGIIDDQQRYDMAREYDAPREAERNANKADGAYFGDTWVEFAPQWPEAR